jgi:nucleotide-binding universal stress UspA family protein
MVVLTIAVVSAMYRLVMQWVTDGSGGSGLSEEEFGGWAVKINAAITFIEYTLTFLVSMAAMVTFIADRLPVLNEAILGVQYRTILAIVLSIFTGWVVNRGPKMAARAFGPATAGVLLLLWTMVFTTIWKHGFHLPKIDFSAFHPEYFELTIGGYVRILAVMTGIEVFANLVAAYEGNAAQKSQKAFNSLLIIMGTAAATMLIVGPAIYQLSDPTNEHVSVFTQTMDALLPTPLPYIGTLIGVAVLMSASAASAQGLQNLALGLNHRNYIPNIIGRQNRFEVADKPVWIEVGIVSLCFLLFGTHEETYLAIYAAGVFILLSMTGWAVTKRLIRSLREQFSMSTAGLILGTVLAALLTTTATGIIFYERFFEGAWTYFLFIPILYATFTYFRNRLGEPSEEMDYLGLLDASQLAGFGFGQFETASEEEKAIDNGITWKPEPVANSTWRNEKVSIHKVVVLLDGSDFAVQALPTAISICYSTGAEMLLLASVKNHTELFEEQYTKTYKAREAYLQDVVRDIKHSGIEVSYAIRPGFIADVTAKQIESQKIDLVITTTAGKSGTKHWMRGGVSRKLVQRISTPILLIHAGEDPLTVAPIKKILVALDGSITSERSLPYARAIAKKFDSEIILMSVPAVPEMGKYRAPTNFIKKLQIKANTNMTKFLNAVAHSLRSEGIQVRTIVTGSLPARTIVSIASQENVDLIMLTSRGRGSLEILVGSVAQRVVESTDIPVFMMPVPETAQALSVELMPNLLTSPVD